MHHLSTKLSHFSIGLFVLLVSFTTDVQSAPPPASSSINRPEAQMSIQEMEKFLEGLSRYLHRQRLESLKVQHQLSQEGEQQEPGSYEADVIDRSGSSPNIESERSPSSFSSSSSSSELVNNSVLLSHPRQQPMANKWPWSLSHLEERTEDGDFKERQQQPPYAKRNSELINSLLGLPRFMKVVG